MAKASKHVASDRLRAGWAELGEGRWAAAQSVFEEALADEETPEACEGLSWAAWWLDDAEALFAARERAYRLYRRRGDAAGAARMATWVAADQLDFHGAAAVASGWLARAHRLLDPLEPGPDHGWLAFHDGYLAHADGDTARARELAAAAVELGGRFGVADLEMLGLALEGASLVACAQVEEGMRCLDEATAAALGGEATIPISSAWACCFLVSACTAVLDFERAFEWCDRIADFAERYGSRYMLAFCRAEYGAVHLWRGRWSDAEAVLEASLEDFSSSRPAWVALPLVGLAELRRRQGRP
ncbi:MAG: LuxR C-terminal-related transcriptional regulator, partial [Gaiellaceae bacterium]